MAKINPRLRAFVKLDKYGQVVPGSLIKRFRPPTGPYWLEIVANVCCTTTTTTSTTTTTTTT